ncbi:DUF308 domain-containing protein [candidate division WOR-3 bacterium]|nr:DUF308 domain-containing protein [candidate division WOR-3 bacterium]
MATVEFPLRSWWVLLLRGALAILFGVIALVWPGVTLVALATLLGVFMLLSGIAALLESLVLRWRRWRLLLAAGLAGIAVGVVIMVWPAVTALVLVYALGAWALAAGALELIASVRFREGFGREWLLTLVGVISALFGLALLIWPRACAVCLVALVAVYAIAAGAALVYFGLDVRRNVLRSS